MNRKYLMIIGVLLVIIGGLIGYMLQTMFPTGHQTGEIPALQQPKEEKVLSNVRNTAIVQAVKAVGPAIVGITTKVYDRDIFNRRVLVGESVGSGVIFDQNGYIATNYHVVGENKEVNVLLTDGTTMTGKVIGGDAETDLAVVKIEGNHFPVAEFGDSDSLVVGETAIAIGNPLGLELRGSVTVGVISALNRNLNPMQQRFPYIQTDAAINHGNSGGALVNAEGKVIGINSAKIENQGVEGLGFAIPINAARPILKALIEHGKIRRPYLGIQAIDKQTAVRYGYEWPEEAGILVVRVDDSGPLRRTPIRSGSFILAIDGQNMDSMTALRQAIEAHQPGDQIEITYRYQQQTNTVKVELSESKQ